MFTFRAEHKIPSTHPVYEPISPGEDPGYVVYQADNYDVKRVVMPESVGVQPEGRTSPAWAIAVTLRKGPFPVFSEDSLTLYAGGAGSFQVVYVMNEAGKTIDTIR